MPSIGPSGRAIATALVYGRQPEQIHNEMYLISALQASCLMKQRDNCCDEGAPHIRGDCWTMSAPTTE